MFGQPVPRVADGQRPREVAPEVRLLLDVPHDRGQLVYQLLDHLVDRRVQVSTRHDAVDETPIERGLRVNRLGEPDHLARPPIADNQRQPLRRPAAGTLPRAVPICRIVMSSAAMARSHAMLNSLPPPTTMPFKPRDGRLPDIAEPVVRLDERAHPFPVIPWILKEVLALLAQVRARAEGALPRPGEDEHRHTVIERCVLKGAAHLGEGLIVERIEHVGPVDRHRRTPVRFSYR